MASLAESSQGIGGLSPSCESGESPPEKATAKKSGQTAAEAAAAELEETVMTPVPTAAEDGENMDTVMTPRAKKAAKGRGKGKGNGKAAKGKAAAKPAVKPKAKAAMKRPAAAASEDQPDTKMAKVVGAPADDDSDGKPLVEPKAEEKDAENTATGLVNMEQLESKARPRAEKETPASKAAPPAEKEAPASKAAQQGHGLPQLTEQEQRALEKFKNKLPKAFETTK
eukprot:3910156-Pyramimonas_sp.AAC.1